MSKQMLLLRGIGGHFEGRDWPQGAMHDEPALEYARRLGYESVLVAARRGPSDEWTGPRAGQTSDAMSEFRSLPNCRALYGFSGGGYNVYWMLDAMTRTERDRLELVVVIGAPQRSASSLLALLGGDDRRLVYRRDPSLRGHMFGPDALLAELGPERVPTLAPPTSTPGSPARPPLPESGSWVGALLALLRRIFGR